MSHNLDKNMPPFVDEVVASKHGVDLPIRVFPLPASSSAHPSPWIVYIHGGAWSTGQHFSPLPWILNGFHTSGFHIVSVSYRLLPYARLDDMVEDVEDSTQWARDNLERIVGTGNVDLDRFAIGGASAGGTLAVLLGQRTSPAPLAVFDIYGAVDLLSPGFYNISSRLASDVVPYLPGADEGELLAELTSTDLSQAITFCPINTQLPLETLREGWQSDTVVYGERIERQINMRHAMRKYKMLINVLLRWDQFDNDEAYMAHVRSLNPVDGISSSSPPTYILHGDADVLVSIDQSRELARRLRKVGVDVGESFVSGVGHVFDAVYTSPQVAGYDKVIQPCLDFIVKHVGQ
ncbi:alpha/beta-hydrolase [Meredithblackwellia eburnea MCA 4105]